MSTYIKRFDQISISDVAIVGGKNASLGELFSKLSSKNIKVPNGFATTAHAFWHFLDQNNIREELRNTLTELNKEDYHNLAVIGARARDLILKAEFPGNMKNEIINAYRHLSGNVLVEVAVRSSATAEDLPKASFAGQHESYLNVKGESELLEAVRRCFASLYTDRAIKYREDNGFAHEKVALSVGIQKMVRSDKASSGVGFTLEPESGFRNIIHLAGVWGLGENIVQGTVTPDEFLVFKPTLMQEKKAIIKKSLGSKLKTMVYDQSNKNGVTNLDTLLEKQESYVLSDDEILQLAKWALVIEEHYQHPMDIEWAKDGVTNEIFIIQARPETVHSQKNPLRLVEYKLLERGTKLASGEAIGSAVAVGTAKLLSSPADIEELAQGQILVTDLTSPDWDPIMKKASAIVTNKGGRTSHASIIARELGVPAIVGTGNGTEKIVDGQTITVSCCEGETGIIYDGNLKYQESEIDISSIKLPEATEAMMIAADPDKAFALSFYPNDGVGLMRMEFIITNSIQIHPMALVNFNQMKDDETRQKIEKLTHHYPDKKEYFVDKLAQGIACIAAAFYPKDVIVRMSDFKTNEYANLLGGASFEPREENPMLGFRGASRYYSDLYKPGFQLECKAIKVVREDMGLNNVKLMIPFCRTIEEGMKVIKVMQEFGLDRMQDETLEIYVMAEIPSNVMQAAEFAKIFDGFSIGSNDLTQLTLGIDRDSALIANLFSEQNKSAKEMIRLMIRRAKEAGTKIGLCGQAPSDFPEFARFLVEQGIDSISFNPDALLKGIQNIRIAEESISSSAGKLVLEENLSVK